MNAPFVVHTGAHKTGTTAVQGWLQHEREGLKACGILVPATGVGGVGNHAPLIRALAEAPDFPAAEAARLREALRQEAAAHPQHTVVISAEHAETPRFRPLLPRLALAIRELGREPIAVFGCREQGALLNSRHAQRRKAFLPVRPFERFVAAALARHSGDWQGWAARLQAAGFAVAAFAYTEAVKKAGVVSAFARVPSLAAAAALAARAPRDEVNPSLGSQGLVLADEVRARVAARRHPVGAGHRGPLRRLVTRQAAAWQDTPFNGFGAEQAQAVRSHFAEGNRAFAERYLDRPWDELFPEPQVWPAVSPSTLEDLDPARREAVLRAADEVLRHADARGIWSRVVSDPGRARSFRRSPSSRGGPPG